MKQITQNMRNGELALQDVPAPAVPEEGVLVRNAYSLLSTGTERLVMQFAKKSLVSKMRERPDLVRQVLHKARTEGIAATAQKVSARLDRPLPLGYSCAGVVLDSTCPDFARGDRVACAGNRCAYHAEFVAVPKNLCARVPEGVSLADAAYVAMGAVALQAVRIATPAIGEQFAVIGLGLLGQLVLQLLVANGCRVVGIDVDPGKAALAERLGAERGLKRHGEDVAAAVTRWSGGRGVDGVLVTAAGMSNDPVELAGALARLKGRVVAVGATRLDVPRRVYYEKELELRLSRSYGPGRYDREYEERGHDYPYAYVRWSEQRNMAGFLGLLAAGRVDVASLTSHRFPVEEAEAAYERISGRATPIGILLCYAPEAALSHRMELAKSPAVRADRGGAGPAAAAPLSSFPWTLRRPRTEARVGLGLIGAGDFARGVLLPALQRLPAAQPVGIVSATGTSARSAGERYGFRYCATEFATLLEDRRIQAVVIATRHSQHAPMTAAALRAGKVVLVEKPLAVTEAQLAEVETARAESGGRYLVGFNRRFAPLAARAREWFATRTAPLSLLIRVNAGELPAGSWLQDAEEGGGRRLGELCHFLDLAAHLAGAPVTRVSAAGIGEEEVSVIARMSDGSLAVIQYVTGGSAGVAKERIELHGEGRSFLIEDWRLGRAFGPRGSRSWKSRAPQKGHLEELAAFVAAVSDERPMPVAESASVASTLATFALLAALRSGSPTPVASGGPPWRR
jgi:predicted dehydrogenase